MSASSKFASSKLNNGLSQRDAFSQYMSNIANPVSATTTSAMTTSVASAAKSSADVFTTMERQQEREGEREGQRQLSLTQKRPVYSWIEQCSGVACGQKC